MARIVSQLLDIAELETFSIEPSEKADLRAICAEVAEFAAPLALAQDKSIALSGTEKPVWVHGNSEMLSRAIRNLVENAINHSPSGMSVEIVVEDEAWCTSSTKVLHQGRRARCDLRRLSAVTDAAPAAQVLAVNRPAHRRCSCRGHHGRIARRAAPVSRAGVSPRRRAPSNFGRCGRISVG